MKRLNDRKLGELVYDGGWTKVDILVYGKKEVEMKIIFSAYEDEKINEEQMEAYTNFKKNIINILEESKEKILEDYKGYENEILKECNIRKLPQDIFELIRLEHILITEKGKVGILYIDMLGQEEAIVIDRDESIIIATPEVLWFDE